MTSLAFKRNLAVGIVIGSAILSVALVAPFAGLPEGKNPLDRDAAQVAVCEFSELVGKNVDEIDRTVFGARPVRILGPDDAATMDFSPDRINLLLNADGIITEVRCG